MSETPEPTDDKVAVINQRRDAMLLRALRTPPIPRPKRGRGDKQSSEIPASDEGALKNAPSA